MKSHGEIVERITNDIISGAIQNFRDQFRPAPAQELPATPPAQQPARDAGRPSAVGVCPHGQLRRQCELCEANATIAEFRALLTECLEYLEPLQDVRDGSYGAQEPNTEMSLCTAIKMALGEIP